jgi:carboxyl-terminal processing protease
VGDTIRVVVRNASGDRTVDVSASIYALKPLSTSSIVTSPSGRKMGYLVLKDFIGQASQPMDSAFAQFQAAGVNDVVLDLRYNGGGLISVATALSSYVAGSSRSGEVFTTLLHNDKHTGSNSVSRFTSYAASIGLSRVYVLAGQRTCSASELVVNGLRPYLDVVLIGDTTCGKPVGFEPASSCGTTFSAVNFEVANARNEGRYFDGFAPTCAIADDLDHALGDPNEHLLSTAQSYADTGSCGTLAGREKPQSLRGVRIKGRGTEPGDRQGMIDR